MARDLTTLLSVAAADLAAPDLFPPYLPDSPPPDINSPTCRIHTDNATWNPYGWRKAFSRSEDSGLITEHSYAYCSRGRGPWAYTSSNVTLAECTAKCNELNCLCFDYFCDYHESADCKCPTIPPVKPLPTATKVACVGDSITAGYLSSCGLNYPNQLQSLLGEEYKVTNYGVGGTTLLRKADHPYWNTSSFVAASKSNADIVIIMLGTNDAKTNNWPKFGADYLSDYKALINVFASMPSKPQIFIMSPPPLYKDGRYNMEQEVLNTELPKLVPQVALQNKLPPPIDLFKMYEGHCPIRYGTPGVPPNATDQPCDWIGCGGVDACHPDNVGYGEIAKAVKAAMVRRRLMELEWYDFYGAP